MRPGGELFIREGHPVLWAMDDPRPDHLPVLAFPYFETAGVSFSDDETYVDHDEPLASSEIIHFNHGLAEILNALWSNGFEITLFEEHDTVPWTALGDLVLGTPGVGWAAWVGVYGLAPLGAKLVTTSMNIVAAVIVRSSMPIE